jgi:hypothetical protein
MSTELAERPKAVSGLLISVTDETIEAMATRILALKVNGLADKKGYELVDTARKECVKARGVITKEHKELKEESLRAGQALDAAKRDKIARVERIENHCLEQLEAVKQEEARIQKEKDDTAYAIRLHLLTAAGGSLPEELIRSMSEHKFNTAVEEATVVTQKRKEAEIAAAAAELERKRIAAEEAEANRKEAARLAEERAAFQKQQAEQEAERKRLQAIEDEARAKERAELEALRAEQARKAAELQAEKDRLEKAERDRLAAEEQKRREADAAEQARIATEERLKREAHVAEQDRIAKEAAEKRALELQPAKKKLNLFASTVMNLEIPKISDDVDGRVQGALNIAAEVIRKIGVSLS